MSVHGKGPLIRPSGTFSPKGRRPLVFNPRFDGPMGEKVAKPDEGAFAPTPGPAT